MIHQSLEINFNTPCIEVCKNDICFKTIRSWSCTRRLTQNQHAKSSKITLSWTQIHPLSLNNRCWPDKLLLRRVNRALSHRAHAREKEQMIERQMTDWMREKYYLVNGLVHTKTSLYTNYLSTTILTDTHADFRSTNSMFSCLWHFLVRKCFCYLCWNLEHILRGTTDVLSKYSKLLDHHRFGQKDAVLHLLYAGLKAGPTVKAVVT